MEGARALSAHTGAAPAGATLPKLEEFVRDWYRWQAHMRRGLGSDAPTATHGQPGMYANILSAAAHVDVGGADADAAFDAARNAARVAAQPLVPPLVPNYSERAPGDFGLGHGLASIAGRPMSTPPGSARSMASARSHVSDEGVEMSEQEVLTELESAVSPADLQALATAAMLGAPCEVNLSISTARLAILGKYVETLSGKRVPHLMRQRKDYVLSWWRQSLAKGAGTPRGGTPRGTPTPASPAMRPITAPLDWGSGGGGSGGVASRLPSLSSPAKQLRELLAVWGAPDRGLDGAFELRVPNENLQLVCSQVAALTGVDIPRQARARREMLAEVALKVRG